MYKFLIKPENANLRLVELTIELAAHMLQLSGIESDLEAARLKSQEVLTSGKAAAIFEQMISALGGPSDLLEKSHKYLVPMPIIRPIVSNSSGYVSEMDVRAIGLSMIHLKAGRTRSSDPIDHGVGLSDIVEIGQWIDKGEALAIAHTRDTDQLNYLQETIPEVISLGSKRIEPPTLIHEILSSN